MAQEIARANRRATASWRSRWSTTSRRWASPTSSSCRWPSTPIYPSWGYQVTGFLRAHQPLWHAGGFSVPGQRAARAGHRRDHRLGAGPFSARRLGAGAVRRHRPLRARGPAPRRAPGLGHAHLQLRPARGQQFPHRQRARSGATAFTSTACAWTRWPRCSTWITRASRANGFPTNTAAARTSRPSNSCARFNHLAHTEYPGRDDHRRGIHRLAAGHPAALPGRAWASPSNGTWAGCTTRWAISAGTRFTASTTRTT